VSISVPTLLVSNLSDVTNYLQNLYSDSESRETMDRILDCVKSTSLEGIEQSAQSDHLQRHCTLYVDRSASASPSSGGGDLSMVLTPIFAGNKVKMTREVVGFTGAIFSWRDVLAKTPHHGPDFHFSIKSSQSSFAHLYHVSDGRVVEESHDRVKGEGATSELQKRSFLLAVNPDLPSSSTSKPFTVTYSSAQGALSQLFPVVTCVCCVGMTLIISAIFFAYMTLKQRQMLEANMRLESKRTYVRFISHEIRSVFRPPLPLLACLLACLLPSCPHSVLFIFFLTLLSAGPCAGLL
jgi:hypothetical protein